MQIILNLWSIAHPFHIFKYWINFVKIQSLFFFFFLISTYLFIFTKSAVGVSSNEQKFQYYLPAYIQTTKIKFVFYHVRSLLTAPIWMRCLEYLISCDYRLELKEEPDHLLTCYNQFHSLIIIIFSALWCYLRRITN